MGMVKASWQNLLIAMGSGKGLNKAIDNFIASLGTMAQNIIPRLIQIAESIVRGVIQAIPKILMKLADAISKFADTIGSKSSNKYIQAGIKLIGALVKGVIQATPQLIAALGKLAINIVKKIGSINLYSVGKAIIQSLLSGFKAVWGSVVSWVDGKISGLKSKFNAAKNIFKIGGGGTGHRIGLREVPYDGYEAILHKGEAVMTAAEVNKLKKGDTVTNNAGNLTVNVYGSNNMSVNELAAAVERRIVNLQKRRTEAWA